MADTIRFAEEIKHLTPDEETWLKAQFEEIGVVDGIEYPIRHGDCFVKTSESGRHVLLRDAEFAGCRAFRDMQGYRLGGARCWVGFEYRFDKDRKGPDSRGRYMFLGSKDEVKIDRVTHLVQKFLRQFRPDDSWSMSYSTNSFKTKFSRFGGGLVFVTTTEIMWLDDFDVLEHCQRAFNNRKDVPQRPKWTSAPGSKPSDLDDLVHDARSVPASDIHNGGLDDQISRLFESNGTAETKGLIEEAEPVRNPNSRRRTRSQLQ